MNTIIKIAALLGLSLIISVNAYSQSSNTNPCTQGNDQPTDTIPPKPDPYPSDSTDIPVQVPRDPNEIIGTKGYDALGDTLQWVAVTASLPYTIYFENDPELATAAAQKVEIRHALHPKADISTFAVGAFGFGSHVFTVEGNRSTYQQRLDLVADMGLYVDVVAGIDIVANEVFWIFQSIDPATGLPPQGTQEGFLPVNDENGNGEGYVSFTIKPKAEACITGDVVTASASIVFDVNEVIPTNVWHNTVDALPPTTQLTGHEGNDNEVLLQFSGTDDHGGCGIKQYKLYVSDNYGAYSLYDTYPVGSEATFPTEYDHCYRFFCLGEDNVGNVEEMKAEAEYEFGNYNLIVSATAYPEIGGIVSGMGVFTYNSIVTLTAIPNEGYEFVAWTNQGVTVSTEPIYTFSVTENCQLVAQFEELFVTTQQLDLAEGWNWWSSYIDLSNDGLEQLEAALSENGVCIKSQYNGFVMNNSGHWDGSLAALDNKYMYRIQMNEADVVAMNGIRINPTHVSLSIQPGWNWVGYPIALPLDMETVFSNYEATANDIIKGMRSFAIYYEGYGWIPTTFVLTPGQGYMYKSLNTSAQTLTFAESRSGFVPIIEDQTYWQTNVHAFADNLNIVAVVVKDDEEQRETGVELGAFVDDECRGSAKLYHVEPIDRYIAFLTVTGKDGEQIEFRLINHNGEFETEKSFDYIDFQNDAVIGTLDQPFPVHFGAMNDLTEIQMNMSVYPNPVERNTAFTLEIPEEETVTEVLVVDALGDVVSHKTGKLTHSLYGLSNTGVYMVKATCKSGNVYISRVVVK